jgi:hypothetical protein
MDMVDYTCLDFPWLSAKIQFSMWEYAGLNLQDYDMWQIYVEPT